MEAGGGAGAGVGAGAGAGAGAGVGAGSAQLPKINALTIKITKKNDKTLLLYKK